MHTLEEQLAFLKINSTEYDQKSDLEQQSLVKKQYRKLAREMHPDKNDNPDSAKNFQQLNTIYNELLESNTSQESFLSDIGEMEINFNLRDLAFFQQDAILSHFEDLLGKINLADEEKKQSIIRENLEFLKLAKKIQEQANNFDNERHEAFSCYMYEPTIYDFFHRRWRVFVIKTFGREGLDDFSYRNALGTGDFSDILALEKIMNPFKLIFAGIVLIACVIDALSKILIQSVMQYISNIESLTIQIAMGILAMMMFTAIIIGLLYTSPLLFNLFFCVDVIIDFFEKIASPFNLIIKPLATKLNVSDVTVSMIFLAAILVGGSILCFLNQFALMIILQALTLVNLYQIGQMFYNLYQISPQTCLFIFLFVLGQSVLTGYASQSLNIVINIWFELFGAVCNTFMLSKLNQLLTDMNAISSDIFLHLPLPREKTNPEFVNIINQQHKKAYLSHCYFNTPEDAEFKNAVNSDIFGSSSSFMPLY